jgi:hypothetical protein
MSVLLGDQILYNSEVLYQSVLQRQRVNRLFNLPSNRSACRTYILCIRA